jgi:hypothetical protein
MGAERLQRVRVGDLAAGGGRVLELPVAELRRAIREEVRAALGVREAAATRAELRRRGGFATPADLAAAVDAGAETVRGLETGRLRQLRRRTAQTVARIEQVLALPVGSYLRAGTEQDA